MTIKKIINDHYNDLSSFEKRVAKNILNGNINIISHTITQAAKISQVSISLINKFCIKIGVSGWKTLKSLAFLELRSLKKKDESFFSEDFILIENTMINKKDYINNFIKKLYKKMYSSKKTIIFANGSTKMVAELIAHKWNKTGGNIVVYDFLESYISINKDTIVIYITISGNNNKIKYYKSSNSDDKNFLITFGKIKGFRGQALELDIYKQFSKLEKAFPVITDSFMHLFLNKFINLKLKDNAIIKHKVQDMNIKDI